ncbi:NAD(P)H-binding protein [Ferrimonas pelagia]|uniref:SDR family oxidoreductase n=1 Tax=Ferrimonas pelagia TaxID=1177826 RepID=A0ABP9EPZ2_9GAMM
MQTVAIAGCGWLGLALAQRLQLQGWAVRGCSRKAEILTQLAQGGIPSTYLDLGEQLSCAKPSVLFDAQTLIINIPPGRHHQESSYAQRIGLLARAAQQAGIAQAVFISSTAVYQDDPAASWCDEQAALSRESRAEMMLAAEACVKHHFEHWSILRCAGLVGGERHPGRFLAGRSGLAGANCPVNLVHREDVIGAIQCVIERGCWGAIYNVAAPIHPPKGEYYPAAARALGLAAPSFSSVLGVGKRISSAKLMDELGFVFRYPDPLIMPPLCEHDVSGG